MAELYYVFGSNEPKKGDKVDITIRGNQLFLCKEGTNVWIELRISDAEKTSLMRALVKDFLEV